MKQKAYVVRVGYEYYQIDSEDAIALLAIANRAVKLTGYGSPFQIADDQDARFVDQIALADIEIDTTPNSLIQPMPRPTS